MEMFNCPSCQHPLWEPVTVPCGHTFCKRCLQGPTRGKCHVCKHKLKIRGDQNLRCNTLLSDLLDKCLDPPTKVNRITRDLQDLITQHKYDEAEKVACKAVAMAPQDVPLRVLRSQVYVHLKQFPESLREAEVICNLQPQDPDGFYRKGVALLNMEKKEEALINFQHCMKLNPQFFEAHQEIEQLLKDFGRPVPPLLTDLLDDLSQNLKLSSVDSTALVFPLHASSINVKLEGNTKTSLTEPCSNGMTKSADINQEQRKRKEPDELSPPDKDRLSKHFKLKDTSEEDGTQKIGPSSSLKDLLSLSDVECSLCIRMFLEPVTTPCGHNFCKECLLRCLDHQPYCPLCKQSLREYLRVGCYDVTALLVDLMEAIFPSEVADRKQVRLTEIAEMSNLVSNVPIFVCTVAFPGVPCPLHVFEPRYRLMMRRCLETGTKSFGMCLYESGKSFADYGCMLEILHLDYLPDGRSLVETVGRRRFRVLQRGQLDGYHKAEIEYLSDKKVEGEELEELQRLHDMVYQQLEECFSQQRGSSPRGIFMNHTSPPPKDDNIQASPDGPFWCWWLLSVLPLDPAYQMLILSMTSLKERLFHLKHILSVFLQSPS
ncbi:PREDICTED: LON peptidase N-terminal domain and RING finger protein 1-like [Nanorana parkeri]|uniref:LON peptidase N-terminal domain and RING finger protein 1-like n=1 Tax=Nanorana parkeri TaxID=125878 RepID=UPI000854F557|nr:PREDICTED: LON peptidase N-terminal domain and RING finger protein 1-like [Nanorana parkeri]